MIIERYLEVVRDGFAQGLDVGVAYIGQIALALGILLVTLIVAWSFGRREWDFNWQPPLRWVGDAIALLLVLGVGVPALRATRFLAHRELRVREAAQATFEAIQAAYVPPLKKCITNNNHYYWAITDRI